MACAFFGYQKGLEASLTTICSISSVFQGMLLLLLAGESMEDRVPMGVWLCLVGVGLHVLSLVEVNLSGWRGRDVSLRTLERIFWGLTGVSMIAIVLLVGGDIGSLILLALVFVLPPCLQALLLSRFVVHGDVTGDTAPVDDVSDEEPD
jgi:hypothetical protein